MKNWPAKDPNEVLDYGFDWSARIPQGIEGDTIVTFTSTVVEGTVVVDDSLSSPDSLQTVTWLSGGADGETCKVELRITTALGRTLDETMTIKIKSR